LGVISSRGKGGEFLLRAATAAADRRKTPSRTNRILTKDGKERGEVDLSLSVILKLNRRGK